MNHAIAHEKRIPTRHAGLSVISDMGLVMESANISLNTA